ncbi:MAG: hypothetical protein ABW168_18690 [Sedimenticola sp.]
MSDSNKKPDLIAFTTTKGKDGKTYYHKIGAAWCTAKDGHSIELFSLPVNGRIVLFPPKNGE